MVHGVPILVDINYIIKHTTHYCGYIEIFNYRVYNLNIATIGLSIEQLKQAGYYPRFAIVHVLERVGYYPLA
jgi:hypothetical protein